MNSKSSFILVPRVYNVPCNAELHLVVINDNGTRLGVLTTVSTAYHKDGSRNLHSEAFAELSADERKIVIERIKKEIADGNIDKAFAFDMSMRAQEEEFVDIVSLFQFIPVDGIWRSDVQGQERDRINTLLGEVRGEYCQVQ